LYILASGQMKVTKQGRPRNVIKAGEYFGEMACIQRGASRQATLEAWFVAEFTFQAFRGANSLPRIAFCKKPCCTPWQAVLRLRVTALCECMART